MRSRSAFPLATVLAATTFFLSPAAADTPAHVLPLERRAEAVNEILEHRLETLLPELMRETDIDMWLVINREYAEDPVYRTLVPAPVFAARRTTMLIFHDGGTEEGVDLLTVSRYPLGQPYEAAWEGGDLDAQWEGLAAAIRERDPERIGIDVSRHWPVADGLTASLRDRLVETLGPELSKRLVSAEELVVRWLETRTESELELWPHVVGLARGVLDEAFSSEVVTPGVTTTDDVAWFLRERFAELDLPVWFMPYVNAQRPGERCEAEQPFCGVEGTIRRGDVLHTDVGICYLRLCTDTQEMAYVLKPDESEPPAGLREALAVGNRWQDLLTAEFEAGRTGNEILSAALAAAEEAGITASIYTHPLGFFGHAPGPTIGMWDDQDGTPIHGDWSLRPRTGYAIEGNVKVPVPEWDGQLVQIKLEQDAVFDPEEQDAEAGDPVTYLAGRQTAWHVIP